MDFANNKKVRFGNGNDLEIYSVGSGSETRILGTSGLPLRIGGDANNPTTVSINPVFAESGIVVRSNNSVELFFNGDKKFETTDDGVKITGGIEDKDGDLGSSGQVLSSTGTQLNWVANTAGAQGATGAQGHQGVQGAPAAGANGKVLKYQSISDTTPRSFSANTWTDIGLSINYTPVSSSSKIILTSYLNIWGSSPQDSGTTSRGDGFIRHLVGSSVIGEQQALYWGLAHSSTYQHYVTQKQWQFTFHTEYSNSSTSQKTFKVQLYEDTGVMQLNDGPNSNDGLSYFTIMEVAT